ncbi:WXG100 family type VII secretion target [Mycolicibacterium sp. CBM1]
MSGELRVEPAVLAAACESLSAGAQHLQAGLRDLNSEVTEMLASWQGSAGGSYATAWRQWHEGASKVQRALAVIAENVGQVGRVFEVQEQASATRLRGLGHG